MKKKKIIKVLEEHLEDYEKEESDFCRGIKFGIRLALVYLKGKNWGNKNMSKNKQKIKFGDIYTNGINYWMVVSVREIVKCQKCGYSEIEYRLRHILVDENENPKYFGTHYDGKIGDIKPSAKFVKSANYE